MQQFDTIRPLAFRFQPGIESLPYKSLTLPFPQEWIPILCDLQARQTNRSLSLSSVPIKSLNRAIRALVPDVIAIGRNPLARHTPTPWLYSGAQIPSDALISLIHSWVRVTFTNVSANNITEALTLLRSHDLHWNTETINLADWSTNDQGTAVPASEHAFALLPDYIAAAISRDTNGMRFGDHQLHFRRASLTPGTHGSELISWPPLSYHDQWYSVVLTTTVQTVPFQAQPSIHCDVSLRRWAGPKVYLPNVRTSVYLLTSVPWLPALTKLSHSFQVASIRRQRQSDGSWTTVWADRLTAILADQRSTQMPLDAHELVQNPLLGLDQYSGNAAAIAYHTRMRFVHKVGAGVTIRERGEIIDQLQEVLTDTFTLIPPARRIKKTLSKAVTNPFLLKASVQSSKQSLATTQRQYIAKAVGNQLAVELYCDDVEVRQALVNALKQCFGIGDVTPEKTIYSTTELTLQITIHGLDGMSAELDLDPGKRPHDRVRDATTQRINHVFHRLSKVSIPTLALVEIMGKKEYQGLSDPKTALRIAFGKTDRLVQFITPESYDTSRKQKDDEAQDDTDAEASIDYRAKNSLLDGLRQLGVHIELPTVPAVPSPLNVVALWLINKNASSPGRERYILPMLVRMSTEDHRILAIAPGFDDWLPYRQALLTLAKDGAQSAKKLKDVSIDFVRTRLQEAIAPTPTRKFTHTLLVCHAQNIRRFWPWASNSKIRRDEVFFKVGHVTEKADDWRGLRIVRVRDSQGHETPEWFAESGKARSAAKGVFRLGNRVFASTHAKPTPLTKYSHYVSKAERWSAPDRDSLSQPQPGLSTWNPGLYELTVAILQPEDGDNAAPWALYTHKLRETAFHYADATALPLPLHLAKLMEEYIRSVDIEDEDEDEE